MTRIGQIKYQLTILENRDTLHSDRAAMAEYDALRRELAALIPARTPAERARWAIRRTRKATLEVIADLRLALVNGNQQKAGYCRRQIAINRGCMHEFIRDLKSAGGVA